MDSVTPDLSLTVITEVCQGVKAKWRSAYVYMSIMTSLIMAIANILAVKSITEPDSPIASCKDTKLQKQAIEASKGFQIGSNVYIIANVAVAFIMEFLLSRFFSTTKRIDIDILRQFVNKISMYAFFFVLISFITLFILLMVAMLSARQCTKEEDKS
jgi:hypothetical protein